MTTLEGARTVHAGAARFGRALRPDECERLMAYFELLLHWNARINLTGARSLEELVGEHLPDALAMEGFISQGESLVDVGSGGGLPGLAFALLRPDVAVTFVEPRIKRVAFLRTALRTLSVVGEVIAARDETLADGRYDAAASRATFAPLEWASRGNGS